MITRRPIRGERYRLGDHTSKGNILYMVHLPSRRGSFRHLWGQSWSTGTDMDWKIVWWCLRNGRETALVIGTSRHSIQPAQGWTLETGYACSKVWGARYKFLIHVSDEDAYIPERLPYEIDAEPALPDEFWVRYSGPFTGGAVRVSGPWG